MQLVAARALAWLGSEGIRGEMQRGERAGSPTVHRLTPDGDIGTRA